MKPQQWLYIHTLNFPQEEAHGQSMPFVCYQAQSPLVHFGDLLMETVFPAQKLPHLNSQCGVREIINMNSFSGSKQQLQSFSLPSGIHMPQSS